MTGTTGTAPRDSRITFLVFTFNEAHRLEYMLRCIQGYGEIVVIDNFSSDETREIAARYTGRIFTFKNPGYIENEETMLFALDKVETKWVYLTYVDELLPRPLLGRLVELSNQDIFQIVEVYRKNFMYGREVFNYDRNPSLRMFVPGAVDFKNNPVHSLGRYLVPPSHVYKFPKTDETSLWHFSSYNTSRLELVHNRYADLEALQRSEMQGQHFSVFRLFWRPLFYFWGTYLGLGGFRGGWPGFFISVQIAYFRFSIEARLWDIDNNVSLESIEKRYNGLKEDLLQGREIRDCDK